jgi:hypothetical protein
MDAADPSNRLDLSPIGRTARRSLMICTTAANDDNDRPAKLSLHGRLLLERAKARALQLRLKKVMEQLRQQQESHIDASRCPHRQRPY